MLNKKKMMQSLANLFSNSNLLLKLQKLAPLYKKEKVISYYQFKKSKSRRNKLLLYHNNLKKN